ncbi:MAG: hypothetical protein KDB60_04115 [Propionibacteriaceae bacterium]|nr:hypothetical protein [Propionibacteriaceae bacterium]
MRKALLALVGVYLVLITWIGYLGADPTMVELFEGGSQFVVIGLLLLFYAVPTVLTIWLVGLLARFTHRLAIPQGFDPGAVRDRTLLVLVLAFFARAATLLVLHFTGSSLGVVAFLAPLAVAVALTRSCAAGTLPRKVLAFLPAYLYIIADTVLLSVSAGTSPA